MNFKALGLMLIFLLTCFSGVFCGCASSSEAFASSANFELNTMNARVGDTIELGENPFNVVPVSFSENSIFSSSNSNVAEINVITGEINCLSVGTTIIYGRVKIGEADFIGDSFILIVEERLIYAETFSLAIEEEVVVGLNGNEVINTLTMQGSNINVMPIISYSNSGVASYDFVTGKIAPISLGDVTIFVTLELSDGTSLTKDFSLIRILRIWYLRKKYFPTFHHLTNVSLRQKCLSI